MSQPDSTVSRTNHDLAMNALTQIVVRQNQEHPETAALAADGVLALARPQVNDSDYASLSGYVAQAFGSF